jgi:hypothetical protein
MQHISLKMLQQMQDAIADEERMQTIDSLHRE